MWANQKKASGGTEDFPLAVQKCGQKENNKGTFFILTLVRDILEMCVHLLFLFPLYAHINHGHAKQWPKQFSASGVADESSVVVLGQMVGQTFYYSRHFGLVQGSWKDKTILF